MKQRLDKIMLAKKMVVSRSEAENLIRLGEVSVDGEIVKKPGYFVKESAKIKILAKV